MVLHKLLNSGTRIYGRKCALKEIPHAEAKIVLEEWHVQGAAISACNLGLYSAGRLVAVCAFSKTLSKRGAKFSGTWELSRYASKGSVVGGMSKCISFFVREYKPTAIVSYSDNCISEGAVYQKLGFELEHESGPDYKYVKGLRRFHKSAFRRALLPKKLKIFDANKSERENCWEDGFYRIWDCGKKKWRLNCQ